MIAASIAFIVVQVWLDLKLPDYMSAITTLVQTAGSTMGEILSAGGMMLVCSLGSLADGLRQGDEGADRLKQWGGVER